MRKVNNLRWLKIIVPLLVLGSLMPRLGAGVYLNRGNLFLLRVLSASGMRLGQRPLLGMMSAIQLIPIEESFKTALTLDPQNIRVRWRLATVQLIRGDSSSVAQLVDKWLDAGNSTPMLETLLILDGLGRSNDVVSLFERQKAVSFSPYLNDLVAYHYDRVAYDYLLLARSYIESNKLGEAEPVLRQAMAIRPDDLYASYYLMQFAQQRQMSEDANSFRAKIERFALSSVEPLDPRNFEYLQVIVPDLLNDSLWNRSNVSDLAALSVWQYPNSYATEHLLLRLSEQYR